MKNAVGSWDLRKIKRNLFFRFGTVGFGINNVLNRQSIYKISAMGTKSMKLIQMSSVNQTLTCHSIESWLIKKGFLQWLIVIQIPIELGSKISSIYILYIYIYSK